MRSLRIISYIAALFTMIFFLSERNLASHTISAWPSTQLRSASPASKSKSDLTDYKYVPSRIAVVQLSDESHIGSNPFSMNSVKCWAEMNGYQYYTTGPQDHVECVEQRQVTGDYWHSALCALYHLLDENQDTIDYVLKLDTDIVAGITERGVEHFLDGADFIGQERLYTAEVHAADFIVRNTPNGREFLKNWYQWTLVHEIKPGFRGGDNGSIHQVINDHLRIKGSEVCMQKFEELPSGKGLSPYFEFVACTRELMGPPRRHHNPNNNRRITIWPAGYGLMLDFSIVISHSGRDEGARARGAYLFIHGIKHPLEDHRMLDFYGDPHHWGEVDYFDGHCVKWDLRDDNDQLAQQGARDLGRGYAQRKGEIVSYHDWDLFNQMCFMVFPSGSRNGIAGNFHYRVPRWNLFDSELAICEEDFWKCRPLEANEPTKVDGWKCVDPPGAPQDNDDRDHIMLDLKNIGPFNIEYLP